MRGGRHIAAALTALVASTTAVEIARADTPSPVSLTWNAPAGCSDSDTILRQVGRLRGEASSVDTLAATATVTLDPSGVWNLQITTILPDGTRGERQIQAESCKAAAEATASILALALTNASAQTKTETETKATATATPTTTPTATATATATPTPTPTTTSTSTPTTTSTAPPRPGSGSGSRSSSPSSLSPHLDVGASFGGTTGDLPSLGLGALGHLGVGYGVFRAEGYAGYWAFGRARFSTPGGANFQLLSVGARTCLSFGDTFSVGPCAAFEIGSMRGESFDVTRPSSGSSLTADGLLGGLGMLSLDKNRVFWLRALVEIGAAFERPQFVLDGVGFVHQPAPVIGRGTVGAKVHF